MKPKFTLPVFFFILFCFLVASRDTLIFSFLKDKEREITAPFMLFIFAISATIFTWIVQIYKTKKIDFTKVYFDSTLENRIKFVKLSFATLLVYVITIYGISRLTPGILSFAEYGIMPALTFLLAIKSTKETFNKRQLYATLIGLAGVLCFALIRDEINNPMPNGLMLLLWICLIVISAYLTSLCSLYQKQLVDNGLSPEAVLMYRFPLTGICSLVACLIFKLNMEWSIVPQLLLISLLTVFLPLYLLCYAFMNETLGRFSIYIFFIPLFTVLLGLLFFPQLTIYKNPIFIVGAAIILFSFLLFEGVFLKKQKV
jgi:drug/metabolite transporter (DMT)-like permease